MRYLILAIFILFSGCSSKKYFEPEQTEGSIVFNKILPASIKDVRRDGATLDNGNVVTKDGLIEISLPKEMVFIGYDDDYIFASGDCGKFLAINRATKEQKMLEFNKKAVVAKSQKDIVGIIFSDNTLLAYDLKQNKKLFEQKEDSAFSVDVRIAAPYFLKDLLLFPTLDGKIVAINMQDYKVARKIVVKSGNSFDSVIFLDILQDRLVAATQKRIISVSPWAINTKEYEIKDVIFVRDRIYIFTTDGKVVLTDQDLVEKKSLKFPFARFVGVIHGKYIYAIEKGGYLIALDIDLLTSFIYKLPSEIDDKIFSGFDKIYYKDGFFQLSK